MPPARLPTMMEIPVIVTRRKGTIPKPVLYQAKCPSDLHSTRAKVAALMPFRKLSTNDAGTMMTISTTTTVRTIITTTIIITITTNRMGMAAMTTSLTMGILLRMMTCIETGSWMLLKSHPLMPKTLRYVLPLLVCWYSQIALTHL